MACSTTKLLRVKNWQVNNFKLILSTLCCWINRLASRSVVTWDSVPARVSVFFCAALQRGITEVDEGGVRGWKYSLCCRGMKCPAVRISALLRPRRPRVLLAPGTWSSTGLAYRYARVASEYEQRRNSSEVLDHAAFTSSFVARWVLSLWRR